MSMKFLLLNTYKCILGRNSNVWFSTILLIFTISLSSGITIIKSNFVDKNTAIATLLEKGGKEINAIFEQFGLYCASCDASIGENIEEGCKMHGLTKDSTQKLISEINELPVTQIVELFKNIMLNNEEKKIGRDIEAAYEFFIRPVEDRLASLQQR